jgi:cytochrome c
MQRGAAVPGIVSLRRRLFLVGMGALAIAAAAGTQDAAAESGASLPEPYASADLRRGRILFLQCVACHDLEPSGIAKVGPSLAGLPGRPAGSVAAFAYSTAMRESGLTWTAGTLDAFIERPSAVVAGTTMVFAGIAAPGDRAAMVRYVFEESAKAR